jgi:hypothetical protein
VVGTTYCQGEFDLEYECLELQNITKISDNQHNIMTLTMSNIDHELGSGTPDLLNGCISILSLLMRISY